MNRIKELREKKGIQQKELAIDLGVTQPTISNWELGIKVPSAKSTRKLAEYFDVSMDYLLGENTHVSVPENGDGFESKALRLIHKARRLPEGQQTLLLAVMESVIPPTTKPEDLTASMKRLLDSLTPEQATLLCAVAMKSLSPETTKVAP